MNGNMTKMENARIFCAFCGHDITEERHYLTPDDCCVHCYAIMEARKACERARQAVKAIPDGHLELLDEQMIAVLENAMKGLSDVEREATKKLGDGITNGVE